ncbi:MAG: metal ABC transporter permease [Spartobacteria bacterium]|nr:metal ABC transporter permease [Spartobacteria bacterium]
MSLFWHDLWQYSFLQNAILAGILSSVACGIMGSFVVVRRTTYVAGAIAHCVLGGMGAARYAQRVHGVTWMTPMTGAVIAAVLAALIVAKVTYSGRQRADTVLSAVWAIGMAVGISFITATPGYYEDLMSYLFGNILMVGHGALRQMAVLDVIVLVVTLLFYDKFLLISFQPELAVLRGMRMGVYHTLLLVMIALTVVLLTQVVGLIMVIALLTLPAAAAAQMAGRLWHVMLVAMMLSLLYTTGGIALSYAPEWPAGATVIECAGVGYILVMLYRRGLNRFRHR